MKTIYISPSTQYANIYYDKLHNEMEVMEGLAGLLVNKLAKYQVLPIMRTSTQKSAADRPTEANALGADYYIELHTNGGRGLGCETYYQVGTDKTIAVRALSKAFALKVNNAIAAITTTNPKAGDRGIKYKNLAGTTLDGNGELRHCKMPAILAEIEFHDTAAGCAWILGNLDRIATALTQAIVAQMGLILKPNPILPIIPGCKVKFKEPLTTIYYVTGQKIGLYYKLKTYTVQEVLPKTGVADRALLKEIKSWVWIKDIKRV
jgi:hypothetical protein